MARCLVIAALRLTEHNSFWCTLDQRLPRLSSWQPRHCGPGIHEIFTSARRPLCLCVCRIFARWRPASYYCFKSTAHDIDPIL